MLLNDSLPIKLFFIVYMIIGLESSNVKITPDIINCTWLLHMSWKIAVSANDKAALYIIDKFRNIFKIKK